MLNVAFLAVLHAYTSGGRLVSSPPPRQRAVHPAGRVVFAVDPGWVNGGGTPPPTRTLSLRPLPFLKTQQKRGFSEYQNAGFLLCEAFFFFFLSSVSSANCRKDTSGPFSVFSFIEGIFDIGYFLGAGGGVGAQKTPRMV